MVKYQIHHDVYNDYEFVVIDIKETLMGESIVRITSKGWSGLGEVKTERKHPNRVSVSSRSGSRWNFIEFSQPVDKAWFENGDLKVSFKYD